MHNSPVSDNLKARQSGDAARGSKAEVDLLLQRLRTLQLRLNSVDPIAQKATAGRILEWRAAAGETRARENRRNKLQSAVIEKAGGVAHDFAVRFEEEFLSRLTDSFSALIPEIEQVGDAISLGQAARLEDDYGSRLVALERRTAEADAQMTELREACMHGYRGLAEVNNRLDSIWDNQETQGIGGWRIVMRQAAAEKEAKTKSSMEAFREEAFDDEFTTETRGRVCPVCGEAKGRRKPKTGIIDDLLGLVSVDPYQCKRCYCRFYRLNLGKRSRTS
jgi:hypothetical protein